VLTGTVTSVRHRRTLAGAAVVDAVLEDGTGTVVLRWLGRPAVPGVGPGTELVVEGTVADVRGVPVILNPLFRFTRPGASPARQ